MFKSRASTITTFLTLFSLFGISVSTITGQVQAERLESDSFVIQFGNFNMTAGEKSSASYNVTDTVGQTFAGPFGQYGSSDYFLGAGFQYIYQIGTFAFSISDLDIPLGSLTPGVHSTGNNILTISTKGAGGFSVYAYQVNPLRHTSGTPDIPNTTCDSGTCTISTAGVWIDQSIPGFGFNADGTTAQSDFIDTTYFRPFANDEVAEQMQPVMSSPNVANDETVTITYKAGISSLQAAGDYETSIIYVAVPGY